MADLTLFNIDRITGDVKTEEIGFSHLFDDLVDHICCDVENQMQQGMSFEVAYEIVKANIGYRGLRKIQEDTLFMVDTKYRNMKKLMKVSSVAGTVMLAFAAIFKISHLPLAGVLLSLGALVLGFLFLPSALTVLWKETKSGRKLFLFVSAFIAGVTFITGMLFKIQHWPGSAILISLGMITGMFLFLPALLYQLYSDRNRKHKRSLYVAGAVSLMIYCAGFWFRVMHWPLAGILTLSGAFLIIFIVFPLFTRVQWKEENHVNARFIFMVVAPLLFILPGALINLRLENNYNSGFTTRLEKQKDLIELQRFSNNQYLEMYSDSSAYDKMEVIHKATNELIAVLVPGSISRETIENSLTEYKEILSQYPGSYLALYSPILRSSDYLPGTYDKGNELATVSGMNGLLTLVSAVLATESAALHQIASNGKTIL